MNLHLVDWIIVGILLAFLIAITLGSRKHMKSVADFLAAGRCAGRYLISVSEGAAGLGAITLVAFWELYYQRGFTGVWWNLLNWPILFIIALTGWVTYRFRQTKALTLAQFFEMRYSRNFRIFAGFVAFVCGVVNFGIFPAVGTRFFIYFCGLPPHFQLAGVWLNTYATLMACLLMLSLFFTFTGGQIAIILTDFLQGLVTLSILVITVGILLYKIQWTNITSALFQAPPGESLLNPFDLGQAKDYTPRFFIIAYVMWFYNWMAWQGTQGFNASAKSPHEQKMSKVLGTWRYFAQELLIPIVAIGALAFLMHPELFPAAVQVKASLAGIADEKIRTQITVPMALSQLLPTGLMGGLCAVMLAAFISNHNSYLHSWGSILIQDVVMPLRGRPLAPKTHLLLLRLSILGVAIFIYVFSMLYDPGQYILMFFRITGGIYLGGAGAIIVGGLYWRKGTTGGAFSAMIVGAVLSLLGLAVLELPPEKAPLELVSQFMTWAQAHITGQDMLGIVSVTSIFTYIGVSLAGNRQPFDLDKMLHRGLYAEAGAPVGMPATGLNLLRTSAEYTFFDKVIYLASMFWMVMCGVVFFAGLAYYKLYGISLEGWANFWFVIVCLAMTIGVVIVVWFAIGGIRDMIEMFARLRTAVRDHTDDGTVRKDPTE